MSTKPPSCSLSYTRHMFVPREEALSVDDLIFKKTVFDGIAYSSIASCTLIIITTVLLSLHPLSKPKTDRVSFRLMIYALCGSIVYSISAILANHAWGEISCRVAGSLVIVGLHLSSFLFFCIGLNLQLVMIHGVDGTQAEKYYVWGSLLLAVALGVLTYASNELVYIATEAVCTYYDPNPTKGFLWRFGIQLLWGYLTMVGEIITFISVVVYMFRVKAFSPGPSRENTSTGSQGLSASHQYRKPLGPRQYRNVVLRIALYPLSALITTGLTTIGTSTNPSQQLRTKSDWALLNALLAVLMFRGTVYASVAVADPVRPPTYPHLHRRTLLDLLPITGCNTRAQSVVQALLLETDCIESVIKRS
ncbi:hypothetical protein L218DRAFT_955857 [Marasmius fiardii PR-910]|nr:hypothetical protein L218DRAFT_955857 [Marasmius fiardii PR-910]